MQVAQALAKVGAVVGAEVVMPCLQRLLKDVDTDVRYYAAEAIEFLKKGLGEGGDKREASASMKMDTDTEAMVVASA